MRMIYDFRFMILDLMICEPRSKSKIHKFVNSAKLIFSWNISMIFPLSCKREISHILVEYSAMDWALFRFEQAVLGFTQFDTGQVAQFIAVDRNPVVFLCRDQVLFFQAPQVQVVAISHPEVAHIGPQSQFEFLCAQFLVLNLYPGIPLSRFRLKPSNTLMPTVTRS